MRRNWTFTGVDAKIAAELRDFLPETLLNARRLFGL